MRNSLIFVAVLCLSIGVGVYQSRAQQEELRCFEDPSHVSTKIALTSAETVNLYVHYVPNARSRFNIPKPLQLENLEQYLQKAYAQRFSVLPGMKPGCYGRNNQTVNLFANNDKSARQKFSDAQGQKGVLSVFVQVHIQKGKDFGLGETNDIITLYIHHLREDDGVINDYQQFSLSGAMAFTSAMSDEEIIKNLENYISAATLRHR